MKRSKGLISIIVALAVLCLVVTTVFAQAEPPGRTPPTLGWDLIPDADPSPAMGVVQFDTTPEFRFTELVGATAYKIQVFNNYDNTLLYTYKGAGVCEGGYCTLTPTSVLGIKKRNSTSGNYYWQVKAKDGGFWQTSWSSPIYLIVLSDGFVSTFNVDKKGWKPVNGEWSITSGSYLKGVAPVVGKWQSIFQKNFTNDFTYQVRMKKPAGNNVNAIMIWGEPVLDPALNDCWTYGVYFQYSNTQEYAIWTNIGGVRDFVVPWTINTNIRPYQWNTLTVVAQFPYQYYFINGNYLGWTNIDTLGTGWAGISFFSSAIGDTLLIDKATMDSLQTLTTLTPDPAMELGKEPAPEGMVPWEAPVE